MAAPLKHLIDPAPAGGDCAPPTACCRMVDALAGDCRSSLGERLRVVEAECGFGAHCSRGCAGHRPADCGFVGAGRVSVGQVARSSITDLTSNAPSLAPGESAAASG